jgi:chromosome segregation ATPase
VPPDAAPPVPSDAALPPAEAPAAVPAAAPSAAAAAAGLAPMPAHGPAGFFAGLPYWYKVIRARMKRSSVIGALKREQQAEERKLEDAVRDLGKRARELTLGLPILELPMSELTALEGERGQLDGAKSELATQLAAEKARFDEAAAECKVRIDEAQAQVQQLQGQLKERQDEQRAVKQRLAELERQIKLETGQRDRRRAEAGKAKAPEQRQDLEQAAAEVAIAIGDHEKQREAAQAEAASLDPPIAELQNELNEGRNRLAVAEKDLATARQALAAREKELGTQEQKLSGDLAQREQAIASKFLEIGKILDGQRSPHGELAPLYAPIDKTRLGIDQRGAQAAQLEQERDRYDRRAVKKGKIVFFSGLGLFVGLIVFLIILFTVILAD